MRNIPKFSDFGLCIKTELLQNGKSQKWLENAVAEKTGLYVDSGYMYKILTGQRNAPKIVAAICEILNIPNHIKENEQRKTFPKRRQRKS